MEKIVVSIVFALGALGMSASANALALDCPRADLKETDQDCPWGGIARELQKAIADGRTAPGELPALWERLDPDYVARVKAESNAADSLKALWGQSINFDEGAKAIILPNAIIDALMGWFGVGPRDNRVVHAGIEHTYGYLLSTLQTSFGYKRARWVQGEFDRGFGLPAGTLVAKPADGGLFSNVTHFAARVSLRESVKAKSRLADGSGMVAKAIRDFDYTKLKGKRLVETIQLTDAAGGAARTVEIRTDFVPFLYTKQKGQEKDTDQQALIYSVRDSKETIPYLVTMFPVTDAFVATALDPKNLGESKPIITRYNAFVPGVTDAGSAFSGSRKVVAIP